MRHLLKKVQTSQQHGYLKIAEHVCREFTDIFIIILVLYPSVWSKSDKVTEIWSWRFYLSNEVNFYIIILFIIISSFVNLFLLRIGMAKAMESPIFFLEKISWANIANIWGHCYLLALPNSVTISPYKKIIHMLLSTPVLWNSIVISDDQRWSIGKQEATLVRVCNTGFWEQWL